MQFFENEIKEYTQFAWSTLDFEITSSSGQLDDNTEHLVTANIEVNGEWQGIVSLTMEHDLAAQLAMKMFSLEEKQVTDEDIKDSASEMMNIIGGNLKSMFPQPTQLGLPTVDAKEAHLNFPSTKQKSHVTFDCMGKKFSVAIHQAVNENLENQPT